MVIRGTTVASIEQIAYLIALKWLRAGIDLASFSAPVVHQSLKYSYCKAFCW
jgi:hypothetical protein